MDCQISSFFISILKLGIVPLSSVTASFERGDYNTCFTQAIFQFDPVSITFILHKSHIILCDLPLYS